jgi:hypothetical protein
MFSPCILDNFIAEYYDRITSTAIGHQGQRPTGDTKDFVAAIKKLDLALQTGDAEPTSLINTTTELGKGWPSEAMCSGKNPASPLRSTHSLAPIPRSGPLVKDALLYRIWCHLAAMVS